MPVRPSCRIRMLIVSFTGEGAGPRKRGPAVSCGWEGSAVVGRGDVQDPRHTEAVGEHAVERGPRGRLQRAYDGRALRELVPQGADLLGVGAAHGDEEGVLAL